MSSVKLYSYCKSSASWRVRIALALKGIKYEYAPVHLVKNEQNSDEYNSLNPMQQVPTLIIDDFKMSQSMPIIEYLDEKFPNNKLFPTDLKKKFQVRQICEIINSGIQPLQNLSVLRKLEEEKRAEWARGYITRGFAAIEKILKETSGKYCMGDEVTAADAFLAPQLFGAKRFDVEMSQFPTITKVANEYSTHKAFIEADAKNQPDNPDKTG